MKNFITDFCNITGKTETLTFSEIDASTTNQSISILGRAECTNKLCNSKDCPLYDTFKNQNN